MHAFCAPLGAQLDMGAAATPGRAIAPAAAHGGPLDEGGVEEKGFGPAPPGGRKDTR